MSGTVSLLIGGFILATFLALFNYLTPSGRVTVTGRVVEVTPNVTGQIVTIPVKPNVPVKTNDVLFQIDPAPSSTRSRSCRHRSPRAKQQVEILKSNYEQATANVTGLTAQAAYNKKRHADIETLAAEGANTAFQAQDKQVQYETVLAQLNCRRRLRSKAPNSRWIPRSAASIPPSRSSRRNSITRSGNCRRPRSCARRRLRYRGHIDGRRPGAAGAFGNVVHCRERDHAGWPFSQNGFQTIKEGAAVDIVFDNVPGRIYHAKIVEIPKGIGQGQIAVSGTLARTSALGGATTFPAVISIPDDMSRESLRLGMSGSATAFAEKAGVIGLLSSILVWVSSYTAYL